MYGDQLLAEGAKILPTFISAAGGKHSEQEAYLALESRSSSADARHNLASCQQCTSGLVVPL